MTGSAFATSATITGTITDLSGALVTSGQVTFSLQPSVDTTISGVTRFVPLTITCGINGSGLVKNLALSGACVVTTNTSQTPSGTWYLVCIWPGNVKTSCFSTYITGDVDITTVNPTPTTSPIYNLVDTLNNQTIAGNKTFSGTTTLSGNTVIGGNETIAGTLAVTGAVTAATSVAINGGTALTTTNRTGTGNLVLATGPTITSPAIISATITTPIINQPAIFGIVSGSDAAAGVVGEYVLTSQTTPQSLTTATFLNLGSVSLTAGDWDISANVLFTGTTATATQQIIGISTSSSAMVPSGGNYFNEAIGLYTTFAAGGGSLQTPVYRASISGSTNYFLVVQCTFGANTCLAQGAIRARRVR